MHVTSVVQVNSQATRAALAEAARGQPYVENAATFLVFCADLQRNQPATITHLLGLPQQVFPIFGLCLGYPDQYSNQALAQLTSYDAQISAYYQQRSQGKLQLNFSQHITKTMVKEARPHMLPYLHN